MEITNKHWFNVISLATLLHIVAVMNINLTGLSAESVHPFSQYVVDLTNLAPAPVKPAPPPPPKPPPPEPKPEPVKPKPPEPKVEPQKVVVPELEQPIPEEKSPPEEIVPPEPVQPESPPASSPKPGTQASKVDYGYYQLILDRLDRLKRYPSRARRRGDQGTVILAFTLNRDGSLKEYAIRQSSGSKALDLEVKKLIRRAAPFPAIPANISQEELELSVPISFTLY